jgi:hypothetical protein
MSYKFQKGDAKLGGAIDATALSGAISADSMSDGINAVVTAGSALSKTFNDGADTVTFDVSVDDSSIEVNGSDQLQIVDGGVTNAMLAGAIADGKLAEDYVQVGEFSGSADAWVATKDTDALSEGSSNLYYTDARARGAVSVTDAGGDGSMAYDSSTGVLTYTGPSASEVRAHFSGGEMIDITDGAVAINASEFSASANAWVATKDTDALSEGSSNLYYTDARARAAVSVTDNGGDGSMAYDSSTGVLTYTGPSASEVRAHFSAGDGLDVADGAFSLDLKSDGGLDIQATELSIADLGVTNAMLAGAIADGKLAEDYVQVGEFSGSADAWVATKDTDALGEGSSNLYFTNARARGAVSVTDAGGDGSMAYDSSTGVFTYTGPSASEVRAHFSAGDGLDVADGAFSLDLKSDGGLDIQATELSIADLGVTNAMLAGAIADGKLAEDYVQVGEFSGSADAWVATKDTDALGEGSSNLYFTDARARAAVSVTDNGGDGSMAYDSSTGVLTYTGPSASEVRAHFSAGAAIDIDAGAIAVSGSIAGDGLSFSSGVLTAQHSVKSIGISNAVAEYGLNFQSGGSISSTVTVTLPKISTADAGRVVMVKVAPLSGDGKVTVACATVDGVTDTIDGPTDTSIDIESGGGAVTLIVADAANNIWAII